MATLDRYRVTWTGATGLPGLSIFYTSTGANAGADLVTFFGSIKDRFPVGTSWDIPNEGDTIDDTTGTLTGGWTGSGGGTVSSSASSAAYAAGVGAFINWNTTAVINGRRLRGRTFLCPLLASQYDTDGTLSTGFRTALGSAAAALAAGADFRVWHRPAPGGGSGSSSVIINGSSPDRVTSLRSRRY